MVAVVGGAGDKVGAKGKLSDGCGENGRDGEGADEKDDG